MFEIVWGDENRRLKKTVYPSDENESVWEEKNKENLMEFKEIKEKENNFSKKGQIYLPTRSIKKLMGRTKIKKSNFYHAIISKNTHMGRKA